MHGTAVLPSLMINCTGLFCFCPGREVETRLRVRVKCIKWDRLTWQSICGTQAQAVSIGVKWEEETDSCPEKWAVLRDGPTHLTKPDIKGFFLELTGDSLLEAGECSLYYYKS